MAIGVLGFWGFGVLVVVVMVVAVAVVVGLVEMSLNIFDYY